MPACAGSGSRCAALVAFAAALGAGAREGLCGDERSLRFPASSRAASSARPFELADRSPGRRASLRADREGAAQLVPQLHPELGEPVLAALARVDAPVLVWLD